MKFFDRFKSAATPPLRSESVAKMVAEVEAIAVDGRVSAEALEARSAELEVPLAHLYAGVGMSFQVNLATEQELQFAICMGNCRDKGAVDCAATLLDIRRKRQSKGQPGFDLVPRDCLSRCLQGPVVEIRSKDGNAVLTEATPKEVARAVKELLD